MIDGILNSGLVENSQTPPHFTTNSPFIKTQWPGKVQR